MHKFDHDLKGMNKKEIDNKLSSNIATFFSVFDKVSNNSFKLIQHINSTLTDELDDINERLKELKKKLNEESKKKRPITEETINEKNKEIENLKEFISQLE